MTTGNRSIGRRLAQGGLAVLGALAFALPAGATLRDQHVVKVERIAKFGEVLFSVKGYALYTYGADTKNHSNCNGSCLSAWPALTVAKGDRPTGYSGLGYIVRSNGEHQVTWRGRPLYLFTSDSRGVVGGNGVANFHAAVVKALSGTSSTTTTMKSYGGY